MKVAAIVPYHTGFCSGQRFRIELWAKHLTGRGIEVEYYPFASPSLTGMLYNQGQALQKGREMLRCYVEQLSRVLRASRPDMIYIYREAALIGPAWIERLTRRWKAPIIYDIDEPLFIPYVSPSNGRLNMLKCFSKVNTLLEMSDHVLAVNQAIGKYAERFAKHVSIVPMAVDTERYSPAPNELQPPRIGWVGTFTNQPNIELVTEPLRRLGESHGTILRVIADVPMRLPGVEVEFIPWAYDIEVPRLQECQIGIVPVKESVWSPWKFFFKLIQYMSLGLPVVATATGSNKEIIRDGENGFLADSDEEWYARLKTLLENPELRLEMGRAARRTAEEQFSLSRQIDFIEGVFQGTSAHASS
ncbi:MAG TPA: glycosyltransferase family 4 protein [Pyrinomonadaceae bacterium]|jgi:glycosyltransferase involved in cell wall biosynthesis